MKDKAEKNNCNSAKYVVSKSTMHPRSYLTKSENYRVVDRSEGVNRSHCNFTKCDFQDLEMFLETRNAVLRPGKGHRHAAVFNEDQYLMLIARRHRNINGTLRQHSGSDTGFTISTQTFVDLYAHRPML
ncbi:hypothetical protein TNCV_3363131 [Trichonephila clavipes]|nr:hypothetical protein TNCV_3363131 [Trichonephila clavipes]